MADETTSQTPAESGSTQTKTKRAYKKSSKKSVKKVAKKVPAKKAANKSSKKAKGSTGTRYSEETKAEAVTYINDNPGRGIIGKALKKYGVSYISLRNWLKNAGKGSKGKKAPKVKVPGRGRPKGSAKAVSSSKVSGNSFDSIIAQIQEKRAEIRALVAKLSAGEPSSGLDLG